MSQSQPRLRRIRAARQADTTFALRMPVEIKASAEDGGPPTFQAVAYSGSVVPGYSATPRLECDYICDLSGLKTGRSVVINLDHKSSQRVGHATDVQNTGKELLVSGVLSAATAHRDEVAQSAKNGFQWEVSMEGKLAGAIKLDAGKTATVNGRKVTGPIYIFKKSTFTQLAFVSQGADEGNSVSIAATAAGAKTMSPFDQYVVSLELDPDTLTDGQRTKLTAAFEATHGGGGTPADGTVKPVGSLAAAQRTEHKRKEEIKSMMLTAMKDHPMFIDQIEKMAGDAINGNTPAERFELELLRGLRTESGEFKNRPRPKLDDKVTEAAIAMSAGLPNIEKHYKPEVLEAVDRAGMRGFGIQQLLIHAAMSNGYQCRPGERIHNGNLRAVMEHAFPPAIMARMSGSFSSVSLPGILGAVANKELLAGYMEEDATWRDIASVKSVSNFHAQNAYRLLDDLEYEQLGPGGEIRHGEVGQETYTRQAKTYAKMLGLTRADIINDDLGAFDDLRSRLGRGAAKKFNNIFWAAFMNNSSFFTAARTNYISGSTTNLGTDGVGLGLGVKAFRKMLSPTADGLKRVGANMSAPTILLVPPELEVIAEQFFRNLNFGGGTTVANGNVFANKYRPVVQNRLSDSAFTGNSTTAWFLLGSDLRPMVVSFLNGQQSPTVESADADFNVLGILFRGYHDFGCDQAEYLSGIMSKGAA